MTFIYEEILVQVRIIANIRYIKSGGAARACMKRTCKIDYYGCYKITLRKSVFCFECGKSRKIVLVWNE